VSPRLTLLVLTLTAVSLASDSNRSPNAFRATRGDRAAEGFPSDWFLAQRVYPGNTIRQPAYEAALAKARLERNSLSPNSALSGATWTSAGPYNIGGRVTALAVADGGVRVFLGSADGGVFVSEDSGVSWTPAFDGVGVASIGALAVNPGNSNTVYVGSGEANSNADSYDGSGLYRSQDAGQSWSSMGLQETAHIARVRVDPADTNIIYVAAMGTLFSTNSYRGLYRSADYGQSWTRVLFVSDSTGVTDVAINPLHPDTVFCATLERVRHDTYRRVYGPECGIWRSVDRGLSWTRLAAGLPAPSDDVGRIALAIAPSRPSMIYAQILSGASLGYDGLGLYRSADGGQTWTRRDTGGSFVGNFGGFGWYFGDVAVNPANPDIVYSLGLDLMRSANGGQTFSSVASSTHPDHHAIWIDPGNPNRLYAGNDGGFYSSSNGGSTWSKSVDLPISQFYAGAIDPSNPSRLTGGMQDNGIAVTTGSVTTWSSIAIGDNFQCIIDPLNPNTLFSQYEYGSEGSGPIRSTDNGVTFHSPHGFDPSERYNWNSPFVMDPGNHNILLAGSQHVYKSSDNGLNYASISGDLSTNPVSSLVFGTISALEISPASSTIYYAGTDDGRVWRSMNSGGTWSEISAGLPVRYVTRMTADPVDAGTVYVTLSGFGEDEHIARIYRSVDNGTLWSSISGNLPDVPVNDIVVDPTDRNVLYAATDIGVWVTRNLGVSWMSLAPGMPLLPVSDLTLHSASRTLVAATYGRSQWRIDLSGLIVGVPAVKARSILTLSEPSPNPSSGAVRFALTLSHASHVDVGIYDVVGRRMRELIHGSVMAGRRELQWDGRDAAGRKVAAGIVFVRATSREGTQVQRIARVR